MQSKTKYVSIVAVVFVALGSATAYVSMQGSIKLPAVTSDQSNTPAGGGEKPCDEVKVFVGDMDTSLNVGDPIADFDCKIMLFDNFGNPKIEVECPEHCDQEDDDIEADGMKEYENRTFIWRCYARPNCVDKKDGDGGGSTGGGGSEPSDEPGACCLEETKECAMMTEEACDDYETKNSKATNWKSGKTCADPAVTPDSVCGEEEEGGNSSSESPPPDVCENKEKFREGNKTKDNVKRDDVASTISEYEVSLTGVCYNNAQIQAELNPDDCGDPQGTGEFGEEYKDDYNCADKGVTRNITFDSVPTDLESPPDLKKVQVRYKCTHTRECVPEKKVGGCCALRTDGTETSQCRNYTHSYCENVMGWTWKEGTNCKPNNPCKNSDDFISSLGYKEDSDDPSTDTAAPTRDPFGGDRAGGGDADSFAEDGTEEEGSDFGDYEMNEDDQPSPAGLRPAGGGEGGEY